MAKTRQQKEQSVQEIKEKLEKAKSVVFADYRGLKMNQLSGIRNDVRQLQAELSITKNTLLKKAFEESKKKANDELFEGPIASLFSYDDEIAPIKVLVKALKEAQIGEIRAGFLGTEYLDQNQINSLANLPSKLELQGKVVGVLVAPLQGMVSVLQGNLRNLVYVLNGIKENINSKGGV